jgi:hypothetical protein
MTAISECAGINPATIDRALAEALPSVVDAGWQRAITRARAMLPATVITPLTGGSVRITSPRSGQTYVTSARHCTCQQAYTAVPGPCWHRAVARAAQIAGDWRTCPMCGGRMRAARTLAGEACYACTRCGHEHMQAVADVLQPYGAV